jgi:hypothetical protein
MDPSDRVDFEMQFGELPEPLLDTASSEVIASYTLTVEPEGVALGLMIGTGDFASSLIDSSKTIRLWLEIASGFQIDPAFSGEGTELGIRVRLTTSSTPARIYERTYAVTVKQK